MLTCYIYIVVCKDIITILPVSLENNHHYHTVEGNEVTFSYKCTGNNVINWWGVGGYPISSLTYAFNKTSSSVDCVNTLNLTLHNVTLDYSGNYTAYPSTSEHFSTSGINVTAHLSELISIAQYVYIYLMNYNLTTLFMYMWIPQ